MPKSSPKPTAAPITKLEDVVMDDDDDDATRKGEPSDAVKADDDEGDTTDAGEGEGYPLGSHPCAQCQSIVANGNALLPQMQSTSDLRLSQDD